mmetsp:Transcript_10476/g.9255  ORF Transcript_10476/g.9255 Transcript_10476/m.9255 type:complete len:198 (+) Transcript_10476:301-894(+)
MNKLHLLSNGVLAVIGQDSLVFLDSNTGNINSAKIITGHNIYGLAIQKDLTDTIIYFVGASGSNLDLFSIDYSNPSTVKKYTLTFGSQHFTLFIQNFHTNTHRNALLFSHQTIGIFNITSSTLSGFKQYDLSSSATFTHPQIATSDINTFMIARNTDSSDYVLYFELDYLMSVTMTKEIQHSFGGIFSFIYNSNSNL